MEDIHGLLAAQNERPNSVMENTRKMQAYLGDEAVLRRSAMGFTREDAHQSLPRGKDLIVYNDRDLNNIRRSFIGCTGGFYPSADYRDEPWGVRWFKKKTDVSDWIPAGSNPFKASGVA
jgi:hypothetical protein